MIRRFAALLVFAALACRAPTREREPDNEPASTARDCGPADASCAPDEYCAFTPRLCGKGKRPGTCTTKPAACDDSTSPVCGCDRKVYTNECEAHAAGIDLAVTGGCATKLPSFAACGSRFCDTRTHYCEIVLSDVFELPTDSTCKPLPPACVPAEGRARECDCFPASTRCRSFCGHLENGGIAGFHLTCRL